MIRSKAICIGLLFLGLILLFIIGWQMGPIPQPQSYHNFADQRSLLGIPHAADVLSNIAFALVGVWGLFLLLTPGKVKFIYPRERWPWVGVALGLFFTSLGSVYYHLSPDDARLVWDRLPMVILFTSFIAALIAERININLGLWLWPLLIIIGLCSIWYWYWSELQGRGDLRFYLSVQLFAVWTTFVMLLTRSPYDHNGCLIAVLIFFLLARLFEMYDHEVFVITKETVSGHTLKHFAAAFGVFWMLWMVKKRKVIKGER
jgi:hypothetical protein